VRFGEMTMADCAVMEKVLEMFRTQDTLRFLEVGTYRGGTACAVKEWCQQKGLLLEYWGIDNGALREMAAPFREAHFVAGDSTVVFPEIPHGLDVAFIDGDHGGNAVILDTLHFGKRVRIGGVLLFHDTAPHIQQTMREAQGPDHPWWYNSVLAAHALMGFPTDAWKLIYDECDPSAKIGGMQAYLKLGA